MCVARRSIVSEESVRARAILAKLPGAMIVDVWRYLIVFGF
jgi:hypothetical protein